MLGHLYQRIFARTKGLVSWQSNADQGLLAAAYGNLGLIERMNLDAAEGLQKKSLALHEALGRKGGMAIQYGNLGLIEHARGNLAAEGYHKQALEIDESLGNKEGIARHNGIASVATLRALHRL